MNRRQRMIKNLAIILGILLAGAIIAGAVSLVMRGIRNAADKELAAVDYMQSFGTPEVSEIRVTNYDGTMRFEQGEELRVTGTGVPETFGAELKEGVFHIYYTKENSWFSGTMFGRRVNDFHNAEIVVTLPEKLMAEKVTVTNGSGSLILCGLEGGILNAKNGSGTLQLEQVNLQKVTLELGSGACVVTDMKAEQLEVKAGSGNVSMNQMKLAGAEIRTGSGSFELTGEVNGNFAANTGSGNTAIRLENHRAEYIISVKEGSGGVWLDGERCKDIEEVKDMAYYTFELDAGSGKVIVEFDTK